MKANPYIEMLVDDFSNKLYNLTQRDIREDRYTLKEFENSYSIFDIFLNQFKFSPEEIFYIENKDRNKLSSTSKNILELIFSNIYQFNTKRTELLNIFKDTIKDDELAFKEALSFCLTSHSDTHEPNLCSEEDFRIIKESNFSLFKTLVEIGIEKDYIKSLPSHMFNTKNKVYQNYLIDKQLFNNEFSFERLQENLYFLKEGFKNHDSKEIELNDAFMSLYISDIIKLPNSYPNFIDSLKYEKLLDTFVEKFFTTIFIHDKPELFQPLNDFALNLITESNIQSNILKNIADKDNILFLNQFSPTLMKLLESLSLEEKKEIFEIKRKSFSHNNSDTEEARIKNILEDISFEYKSYSADKNSIQNLLNASKGQSNINPLIFDYFIDNFNKHNPLPIANFYISSWLLEYCKVNLDDKYIHNEAYAKEVYLNTNKFELLKKHASYIQYCFEPNHALTIDNLYNLSTIQKLVGDEINFNKYDKNLLRTIQEHFYSNFSTNSPTKITNDYFQIKTVKKLLGAFSQYSLLFPNNNFLEILCADETNPEWKNINIHLEYRNKKIDKTKTKDDYPLAFALIELSDGKALTHFINEENLKHLSSVKYKGKNVISYFIKNDHSYDNKIVHNMLNILLEHSDEKPLKTLILDHKPTMKVFEEFCSDPKVEKTGLKQKILYKTLNNSISEEKNTSTHKPRKI